MLHRSRILRRCDEFTIPAEALPLEEDRLEVKPRRAVTAAQVSPHTTPCGKADKCEGHEALNV